MRATLAKFGGMARRLAVRRGNNSAMWVKAHRNLTGHEIAKVKEGNECNAEADGCDGLAAWLESRVAQAMHEMQVRELHCAAGLFAGIARLLALWPCELEAIDTHGLFDEPGRPI